VTVKSTSYVHVCPVATSFSNARAIHLLRLRWANQVVQFGGKSLMNCSVD